MVLTAPATPLVAQRAVRCRPSPACCVCGAPGGLLYSGMPDRLFGVAGEWSVMKCSGRECGSLWLDPMPVAEDLVMLYERYFTHEATVQLPRPRDVRTRVFDFVKGAYLAEQFDRSDLERYELPHPRPGLLRKIASLPAYIHPVFQARLAFPLRAIGRKGRGRLLDVGCGSGELLELVQRLGWRATGVDFDPAAVSNSRGRGLDVRLGSVEEQQFPESSFDLVVLSHVIEHLPDPVATLRECRRVLAPGGAMLVVTPNAESWGHSLLRENWLGLDVPRHLCVFTSAGLARTAGNAGFRHVSISTSPGLAQYVFFEAARLAKDSRFRRAGRFYLPWHKVPPYLAVLVESAIPKRLRRGAEELIMEAAP